VRQQNSFSFGTITASLMGTPFFPSTPASTLTKEHSTPSSQNGQGSFVNQWTPTRDPIVRNNNTGLAAFTTPGGGLHYEYYTTVCQSVLMCFFLRFYAASWPTTARIIIL